MLTSYWVRCPQSECGWSGSLLPQTDVKAWHGENLPQNVVVFHCPGCDAEWPARVIGDDVVPLPMPEPSVS
jgi:hypothetical protein